ncbi:MAG TPA: glycosyltransferase family 4 protein [Hyphomicrobiaceae bacterium]|nr:glycosyltransferase family 4 protein [Hyphomicrobiaceae bacterium]
MRTLVISPRQFWPLDTGGKLRDFHLASELARRGQVTYLCYTDDASPCPQNLAEPFEEIITVPHAGSYSASTLARGLLTRAPATVLKYTTPAMTAALAALLERKSFDTVQVETICLAAYMPALRAAPSRPRIVTDWHNIESELMQRHADHITSAPKRLYARMTASKLRAAEDRQLAETDVLLVCSARERDILRKQHPRLRVEVVENGVDAARFKAAGQNAAAGSLLFVGSMDYHANKDAVLSFAATAWPSIRKCHPDLAFRIVGRNPDSDVLALKAIDGIEVTGSVPDVLPYYSDAVAALVPLRVGGGTRLKILEAMAAGLPVISTTLGAEGLAGTNGKHLLIADTSVEMLEAVTALRRDRERASRIAADACDLVARTYDWRIIGRNLAELHRSLAPERLAA